MITCDLRGGLGNQLFQIFATISCAIDTKKKFYFFNIEKLGGAGSSVRPTYWQNLLTRLKPFLTPLTNSLPEMNLVQEKGFHYTELPVNKIHAENKDVMLHGYFQSYKYFEHNFNAIYNAIGFEKIIHKLLKRKYINKSFFNDTISMHFRLGDYKHLPEYHPIAKYEYYKNALSYITDLYKEKNFCIIYFCEEEDITPVNIIINQLKEAFSNVSFLRGDNSLQDWEQMLVMSCCENNIIANSSFSWWAAYLNTNKSKIVCYPEKWFGEALHYYITSDLCPAEWIKFTE